jgi:hypothetical protein
VPAPDEGEVLGDGQRDARGEDALDHRVVGGVEQQHELARGRAVLQPVADHRKIGVGQAHPGEDDAEGRAADPRLRRELGGELQVGQPGQGEDREILAADQGGERVDRRDPRLYRLAPVRPAGSWAVEIGGVLPVRTT